MALFRFFKKLLAGDRREPPSPPKHTSSHAHINLDAGHKEESIVADLREARLVEPVLVEQFEEDARPFVFGESFFIFTDACGYAYDHMGKKLRQFTLPEKIFRGFAVDQDLLLLLGSQRSYLWRPAKDEFLPLDGQPGSVQAVAWVEEDLVLWEEDLKDDEGYHGEKSHRSESIRLLNPKSGRLSNPKDQTLGGKLVEHHYSTRYSSRTTSRLSPESQYRFRAQDPAGLSGTCGLTPGREIAIPLYFTSDPPNGLEIGVPTVHLSAFPRFPGHPGQTSHGSVTGSWAFTRCQEDTRCTIAVWHDEGLRPLLCCGCRKQVNIRATACECGADLPPSGVKPDAVKPGQLRLHTDFATLWAKGAAATPTEAPLDHLKNRVHQFCRFEGLVVGVTQYGKLECYLSPEFEEADPLFTAELRPFYGTTFRNPILDTKRQALWVLSCNRGPLRFTLDPEHPGFGEFANTYEDVVRKPEPYHTFLDLLLAGENLFVQGDFFISVYGVKDENLEHISTTDKLGKSFDYELTQDEHQKVFLRAPDSHILTWDGDWVSC